jgi:hypothetical protein
VIQDKRNEWASRGYRMYCPCVQYANVYASQASSDSACPGAKQPERSGRWAHRKTWHRLHFCGSCTLAVPMANLTINLALSGFPECPAHAHPWEAGRAVMLQHLDAACRAKHCHQISIQEYAVRCLMNGRDFIVHAFVSESVASAGTTASSACCTQQLTLYCTEKGSRTQADMESRCCRSCFQAVQAQRPQQQRHPPKWQHNQVPMQSQK